MTRWLTVRLGEVLRRSEETITILPDAEYREVTVKLWGKGVVLRRVVAGVSIAASRRFVARAGQLILSRIDARNGAIGIVPSELDGAVVTNDFPLFNANPEKVDRSFLGWLTTTRDFVELCQRASEGTTNRVRLQEDRFLALEIPLPPLAEQQRIVARIEELAAKMDEAGGVRARAVAETEVVVLSETSRAMEELHHYPKAAIRALGIDGEDPVQTGPFGAQLHKSEFVPQGVPVLNVGNVWPEGLRLNRLDHVLPEKAERLSRYSLKAGDLLFARSGATLGKVCLVPRECEGWLMTGHLFRVRFDQRRVCNSFAFAAFRGARSIHDQIFGQVRGATRPGYNTTLLGNVELPIPPLPEQRRIVAELDALQAKVDALKSAQAETAAELDALLPSILDRAFAGAL